MKIGVDVDGVLLKWEEAFNTMLQVEFSAAPIPFDKGVTVEQIYGRKTEGLVKYFNGSKEFSKIEPFADAVQIIPRLKSKYDLVAITAVGSSDYVDLAELRKRNLDTYFQGMFSDIVCTEYLHDGKRSAMRDTGITHMIDDSPRFLDQAKEVGVIPIFMNRKGVKDHSWLSIDTWYDIFDIL